MKSMSEGTTSLSRLYAVYNDPTFQAFGKPCDAHLKSDDGTEFKVYSKLLSKHSEFFKALFSIDEEHGQSVVIHGIRSDILGIVLIYLHERLHLNLNTKNMLHLLVASDFLIIEPLILQCRSFVLQNINEGNCISIFLAAYRIKSLGMEEECRRFVLLFFEKAVKLSKNEAYDLPYNTLKFLLSHRSINVSEERVIWSFIEEYVKKDKSKRYPVVPELLRHLCINEIDNKLASSIITSVIIRRNDLYRDLGDPQVTLQNLNDKEKVKKIITYRNEIPLLTGNRLPRSVYFVTKSSFSKTFFEMFISYDDHLDVWRKFSNKSLKHKLHTLLRVGHRVYIFLWDRWLRRRPERRMGISESCIYDISRNKILTMTQISHNEYFSSIIFLEAAGQIYALNKYHLQFQRYVDETNQWMMIEPFPHQRDYYPSLAAVSLNGQIYVLVDDDIWVYDTSSSVWKMASSPGIRCSYTGLIAYQGKIFLVGGYSREWILTRSVRVYDPSRDEWSVYPDVPFDNDVTTSGLAVVKGRLFVYKERDPYSVAFWDGSGEWKLVDDRSPLRHMCLYSFCCVEEEDVVRKIMRMNREADASSWIKTGLGREMLLKPDDP